MNKLRADIKKNGQSNYLKNIELLEKLKKQESDKTDPPNISDL
jgi:hypothetical protein